MALTVPGGQNRIGENVEIAIGVPDSTNLQALTAMEAIVFDMAIAGQTSGRSP